MKDVRYSVLLALTNISDKAILEAELAPVGAAVVPPSGTSSENGMPSWSGDTRRGSYFMRIAAVVCTDFGSLGRPVSIFSSIS